VTKSREEVPMIQKLCLKGNTISTALSFLFLKKLKTFSYKIPRLFVYSYVFAFWDHGRGSKGVPTFVILDSDILLQYLSPTKNKLRMFEQIQRTAIVWFIL
jgi:hypothetical protein